MKRYKSTKAIIKHAREFLSDPANYAIGTLAICVRPQADEEWSEAKQEWVEVLKLPEETPLAPADLPSLETMSEHCACCVLGAIREHTDLSLLPGKGNDYEGVIIQTPAGRLVEEAAQRLYPVRVEDRESYEIGSPDGYSRAVDVNDGSLHKTPQGAYKATLRILDAALEAAS